MDTTANYPEKHVITAFLWHDGKILLLKRSAKVGSYRGSWAAVSGYLETGSPLDQALREIREETGLDGTGVHLVGQGRPLSITDPDLGLAWIIHPFLFRIETPEAIRLDWEHDAAYWVLPEELPQYRTVPGLIAALESCRHHHSPAGQAG